MDKDMMKINDDELENVSGGSWEETSQLRRLLHAGNSNALLEHFLELRGIEAMFFEEQNLPNEYVDKVTGKCLTHEEVIKRLAKSKFL